LRLLAIVQLQSLPDFGEGNPVIGLGEGVACGPDVEAILGILNQSFEESKVLDRDDGGRVLPPPMHDDPLPLILRPIEHFGELPPKFDHAEACHRLLRSQNESPTRTRNGRHRPIRP